MRRDHVRKAAICLFSLFFVLVSMLAGMVLTDVQAQETVYTARPSVSGKLHVENTYLADEKGNPAALRGLSTHGLTWYPGFINEDLFSQVSEEWNCNLIRLAMYSELYCGNEREESLRLMREGIEYAVRADMYVLVDWHILNDKDPNENIEQAEEFFSLIAEEYGSLPNILYEICNEPNGDTTWTQVSRYAERIIPVIREKSPDSVIIVGTPDYDRALTVAMRRPLPFDNIMYTCHFYTATHYDELFAVLQSAIDGGLPVFITECGVSEASGDGRVDLENAVTWFEYLKEKNLSYAVWSLSDKAESSAMLKTGTDPSKPLQESSLTPVGRWVKELVKGTDPKDIPRTEEAAQKTAWQKFEALIATAGREGLLAAGTWPRYALISAALVLAVNLLIHALGRRKDGKIRNYDELTGLDHPGSRSKLTACLIACSTCLSLVYIVWRIRWSVPFEYGWIAVAANLILLAVEILGFCETLIHYRSMAGMREHPLPLIDASEYPEVDIFIATYNESVSLLRRTVNGCIHLKYPDPKKVHIWICDDNRRKAMRELAAEMGVGYFDRPDNSGAKAGNLNHAMSLTHAPYIVTLDADMIPRSEFLMKTIPYFVDAEKRNAVLPEEKQAHLGLLQTPQSFYDPDVFQHALYAERRAPNEQDFFYRTIEPARTTTNSVIYGGSNTVLSRKALNAVGGFYTGSITEDFATGLLIESAGFISLAISEPLASGRTPNTFGEHIQQRTRWARGVIVTAKKLRLLTRKGLDLPQRLSYLGSAVYWYSPIKNYIYLLSPLVFAVLSVPVFRCTWLELIVYWLPMFILQEVCLRAVSHNAISTKWSGIYETCVMPFLFMPVIRETLGMTMSTFKVTDKDSSGRRNRDFRMAMPFVILIALSVIGIVRCILMIKGIESLGILVLLFWLIRNLYFLIMALFLADGRDSDGEPVNVHVREKITVNREGHRRIFDGVTRHMTEHSLEIMPDVSGVLQIGDRITVGIDTGNHYASLKCVVIGLRRARRSGLHVYTAEIVDFGHDQAEYQEILYDRIPALPQNLNRDLGIIPHLWVNIAHRLARTKL